MVTMEFLVWAKMTFSMWYEYNGIVDNYCIRRIGHIVHFVTQVFRHSGDSNHC